MIALVAAAVAGEVRVAVRVPEGTMGEAVPRVYVTDAAGAQAEAVMNDSAGLPDGVAGDGIFTGAVATLGDGPFALVITDGGDQKKWTGSFPVEDGLVAVGIAGEGELEAIDADEVPVQEAAAAPAAPPGQPQPSQPAQTAAKTQASPPAPAAPPSTGTVAAWLVAVALVGWSLAGTLRGGGTLPPPVPGARPALPGEGLVPVTGDPDALVARLAGPFRVVLAGRPPAREVPAGTVFALGPGRVTAAEVADAARALDGRGPPVVIVVASRLQVPAGADRDSPYEDLERRLPAGVVAYAFGTGAPELEVGEDGALLPREA